MNTTQSGYIALSIIIVTMAVIIAVTTTVSLLAIGEAQSSLTHFKGEENLSFVEGCAEDALLKIQSSKNYAGGTISRPEGICSVTINAGDPNWDISIATTSGNYKRTIRIQASRSAQLSIIRWQEI